MSDKGTKDESAPVPDGKRRKKKLPTVDYLLKHGDPETANEPKTWLDIAGWPLAMLLVFVLSLQVFLNFPWHKLPNRSQNAKGGYFDRKAHMKRVPHLNQNKEKADTEL